MEEEKNLVPRNDFDVVPMPQVAIEKMKEVIQTMQRFIQEMLVPGEDYGQIPGIPKPTLFKPGAEKLLNYYGFYATEVIEGKTEDWDKPFFSYTVKVQVFNKRSGYLESECIGNANSREKRYLRKDGTFDYSMVNTLIKMAHKRALVGAVLLACRASTIFTQDVEDLPREVIQEMTASRTVQADDLATEPQRKKLYAMTKVKGITPAQAKEDMLSLFGKDDSKQLTKSEISQLFAQWEKLPDISLEKPEEV